VKNKLISTMALAISLAAASTAFAADLAVRPVKAPPPMFVAPSWTGCYVGGNLGAGWDNTTVTDPTTGATFGTFTNTAFVGGGQVGCDYQFAATNWVLGIQGMFDGSMLKANAVAGAAAPFTIHGELPWFGTLTGRLGYAVVPNWLLYAKGGAAWTHVNASVIDPLGVTRETLGFDQSGWTVGGGAEWKIAPNWSVFAEYDYLGFNDKLVTSQFFGGTGNVHQNVQVVLVGVNLRFGGM
jgi:outer membrane immunogenic protein